MLTSLGLNEHVVVSLDIEHLLDLVAGQVKGQIRTDSPVLLSLLFPRRPGS